MNEIINKILSDFEACKKLFPYIKKKYSYFPNYFRFEGYLIPTVILQKMMIDNIDDAKEFALNVNIYVPKDNYLKEGAIVYDVENKIEWNKMPEKDRHYNSSPAFKDTGTELCTHLIKETPTFKNPLLEIMKSAYGLYSNYKHYIQTGKIKYHGYKHGYEGVQEYEQNRRKQ